MSHAEAWREDGINCYVRLPIRVLTIGAHEFNETTFFDALQRMSVGVFVDTRRRRSVRGHQYTFVNAKRIEARLDEMGIPYVHRLDLAPSFDIVKAQGEADRETHTKRRDRTTMSPALRDAYTRQCLDSLDARRLIEDLGNPGSILFCVEREPQGCHRSPPRIVITAYARSGVGERSPTPLTRCDATRASVSARCAPSPAVVPGDGSAR